MKRGLASRFEMFNVVGFSESSVLAALKIRLHGKSTSELGTSFARGGFTGFGESGDSMREVVKCSVW